MAHGRRSATERRLVGPYNLLGWSFGGVIAHELAMELRRRGCVVAHLILLDADPTIDTLQSHGLDDWRKQLETVRFYDLWVPEVNEPLTCEQIDQFAREQGPAEYSRYKQLLDMFVQNIAIGMSLYRLTNPPSSTVMCLFFPLRGRQAIGARLFSERGGRTLPAISPCIRSTLHIKKC